jgi:hypothetical protein
LNDLKDQASGGSDIMMNWGESTLKKWDCIRVQFTCIENERWKSEKSGSSQEEIRRKQASVAELIKDRLEVAKTLRSFRTEKQRLG